MLAMEQSASVASICWLRPAALRRSRMSSPGSCVTLLLMATAHSSPQARPSFAGQIKRDLVGICPGEELVRLLAEIVEPTMLAYTTPHARLPVSAKPTYSAERIETARRSASLVWHDGWTPTEERRTFGPLDRDRSTVGARYLDAVRTSPWLDLSMRDAGVLDWRERLVLLDALTRPPLEWADVAQAHSFGMASRPLISRFPPDGGTEISSTVKGGQRKKWPNIVRRSRLIYLVVRVDVCAAIPLEAARDAGWAAPEDDARPGSSRQVRRLLSEGRMLLAALGAWPWAHLGNQALATESNGLSRNWLNLALPPLIAWHDAETARNHAGRKAA